MKKHNENSPFLIGDVEAGDKITEAKQKSWIVSENEQLSFIQNKDELIVKYQFVRCSVTIDVKQK